MTSFIRGRVTAACILGILGAGLAAGCGHGDSGTPGSGSGPAAAARTPAMPSGMPADARQQTLQADGTVSPAALAAEHNAAMRRAAKH